MIIGLILLAAVIGGTVYFVKKNPKYSPEQEAKELEAKAAAEAAATHATIEADIAKAKADVSKL